MTPHVEIIQEHEHPGAWVFDARVDDLHARSIRLAWQDYEDWSRGTTPPHAVARAAFIAILEHHAIEDLPATFDAARYRRTIPSIDNSIQQTLGALENDHSL
ncbi:MAG: hypothetical protein ACF8GE_11235 [Phycisphaerales bacterium JB043]